MSRITVNVEQVSGPTVTSNHPPCFSRQGQAKNWLQRAQFSIYRAFHKLGRVRLGVRPGRFGHFPVFPSINTGSSPKFSAPSNIAARRSTDPRPFCLETPGDLRFCTWLVHHRRHLNIRTAGKARFNNCSSETCSSVTGPCISRCFGFKTQGMFSLNLMNQNKICHFASGKLCSLSGIRPSDCNSSFTVRVRSVRRREWEAQNR